MADVAPLTALVLPVFLHTRPPHSSGWMEAHLRTVPAPPGPRTPPSLVNRAPLAFAPLYACFPIAAFRPIRYPSPYSSTWNTAMRTHRQSTLHQPLSATISRNT
ncbi:hypothetical protein GN244_ATG07121 [Phytophthora infestans]|uniref:Uncharacterized protein n=1 Tax=Phytophthora infestans TaxID=4787 RepID=A0A833WG39_PHYIN|nr:hypothetical protein GN244_ATG07121 [Phytophthora infestans]